MNKLLYTLTVFLLIGKAHANDLNWQCEGSQDNAGIRHEMRVRISPEERRVFPQRLVSVVVSERKAPPEAIELQPWSLVTGPIGVQGFFHYINEAENKKEFLVRFPGGQLENKLGSSGIVGTDPQFVARLSLDDREDDFFLQCSQKGMPKQETKIIWIQDSGFRLPHVKSTCSVTATKVHYKKTVNFGGRSESEVVERTRKVNLKPEIIQDLVDIVIEGSVQGIPGNPNSKSEEFSVWDSKKKRGITLQAQGPANINHSHFEEAYQLMTFSKLFCLEMDYNFFQ